MKKFQFPLDSVKNYKDQELDALKREHGLAVLAVRKQEAVIEALQAQHDGEVAEFNQKKLTGVTILEAQSFDLHIRKLQASLEREHHTLLGLQAEEEKARAKVVEKKQEISSIEKLREKRVEEYNKAAQKEEETFIEELVLNKRAAALHTI